MKNEVLDRFFVIRKCAACGEILPWSRDPGAFCRVCLKEWDFAKLESCQTCFQSATDCTCMPTLLRDSGALCLRKLFFYHPKRVRSVPNRLVYFIKRHQNRRVFLHLAGEWMTALEEEWRGLGIQNPETECLFVGLPRGWTARSLYGFDQSDRFCKALSKVSGVPYLPLIRRRLGGATQKKLGRRERLKNMKRRLVIRERRLAKSGIDLSGRTVILVDDLVTTGATMAAAAALLRGKRVRAIIGLSLASKP